MSPRRLASAAGLILAAPLACRPVTPTPPEPGGPGPGPLHGPSEDPPDPIATAIEPPAEGATATATAETQGPGISVDAATQTQRITAWDGPPHLLANRPGSPGGWPDLPGRAVGVLWATSLYSGRADCVARGPDDRVEYHFSRGPHPPHALYFPSDGRGFNFIRQWIVPLPDGTTTKVDAAMFRPATANVWGLHACAHLVELAVNSGRGGRGLHFIATDVRVLDGTTAFPWQLARVLADLRARSLAHAEAQRAAREPSPPSSGPWITQNTPGMLVTWLPETDQLEVLVWSIESRTATRALGRETIKPEPCPPNAPCARRDVGTFELREVRSETVDFAVRFELDRTARLVRETIYTPRHRSSTGIDRIRIHN